MKKRVCAMLMALGMVASLLAGCGGAEGNNDNNSTVSSSEEVAAVDSTNSVEEPDATEEVVIKNLAVSDWGYESLYYISKDYFVGKENDMWFLLDNQGNKVGSEVLGDFENGWDMFYPYLEDGAFAVTRKLEDGTYLTRLFDMNIQKLMGAKGSSYIIDYRDGLVKGIDESANAVFLAGVDDRKTRLSYKRDVPFLVTNRGKTIVVSDGYYSEDYINSTWYYLTADLLNGDKNIATFKSGDQDIVLMKNLPDKDGWIHGMICNLVIDSEGYVNSENGKGGMYNISGEFVEFPDTSHSTSYFVDENGCQYTTAQNGIVAVNIGDGETCKYKLFDLNQKDYVSENTYKRVTNGVKYNKYYLVQNMDEKWGYIDTDTWEEVGEWYDDASSFCNGYAMVNIEGMEYIIDENMQICSEGIEGTRAQVPYGYLEFSDLDGEVFFYVNDGEVWHVVSIVE